MKIAILGAGPSGMMAAHAASDRGHEIEIFDRDPDQSRKNSGIFFLHSPCNLPLRGRMLRQTVLGVEGMTSTDAMALAYGLKVYGEPVLKNSVLSAYVNKEVLIYNAGQALNFLWDMYGHFVTMRDIAGAVDVRTFLQKFDKVICTIPAPAVFSDCDGADFKYTELWIKASSAPPDEFWAMYNVNPQIEWYRCSALFGQFTMEYAYGFDISRHLDVQSEKEEVKSIDYNGGNFANVRKSENWDRYFKVKKVISSNMKLDEDLHGEIFYTGRYGAWDKTCLMDGVYNRTLRWLEK